MACLSFTSAAALKAFDFLNGIPGATVLGEGCATRCPLLAAHARSVNVFPPTRPVWPSNKPKHFKVIRGTTVCDRWASMISWRCRSCTRSRPPSLEPNPSRPRSTETTCTGRRLRRSSRLPRASKVEPCGSQEGRVGVGRAALGEHERRQNMHALASAHETRTESCWACARMLKVQHAREW